ncbi:DUF1989 domain-containing protein [Neisseriaceae bacterium PsAf]|nr:DUF1989 domain-containing protein [Neisseriaceae bacterium PsAf]
MDHYKTVIRSGSHWSLRVRRGVLIKLTDLTGNSNVGMLFYNHENLFERYNAPDTLKCQHTFKLTKGNCLYSDMGRIFASIVKDDIGWHETVCGNITSQQVTERWGRRDYQHDRNQWHQNGHDAFLVELEKYGLNIDDMSANVNWFNKVAVKYDGSMYLVKNHSQKGNEVCLRFEMDTLVLLHTCPHPLEDSSTYPEFMVQLELEKAPPVKEDDYCMNSCDENRRGFENNALYYFGA